MTITTNPSRDEYTSTAGQTVFNYTFKIYANTDLNVYVTPSGQSPDDLADLTTDYIVDTGTIGDEAGGFITFNTPLNNGDAVTIVSAIPYDRTVDYQNNGDFLPETVNDDNDRQVSQIKQILEQTGRTLQFQESLQGASTLSLPDPVAANFMRWKADLTGLENVELVDGALVVGNGQLLIFPTVAALKASTSVLLVSGVNVQTQGYYSAGDGGGANYLIVTPQAADEYGDHTLVNGNVAVLQVNEATTVKMFGAIGDDTADDTPSTLASLTNYGRAVLSGDHVVSTITLASNQSIIGTSSDSLRSTGAVPIISIQGVSDVDRIENPRVEGFEIFADSATQIRPIDALFVDGLVIKDISLKSRSGNAFDAPIVLLACNDYLVSNVKFRDKTSLTTGSDQGFTTTGVFGKNGVLENLDQDAAAQGFSIRYQQDTTIKDSNSHNNTSTFACGFLVESECKNITVENCFASGHVRSGFYVEGNVAVGVDGLSINNCYGYLNGEDGIQLNANYTNLQINGGQFYGNTGTFGAGTGRGISGQGQFDISIHGVMAYDNTGTGIKYEDPFKFSVTDCSCYDNGLWGIEFTGSGSVVKEKDNRTIGNGSSPLGVTGVPTDVNSESDNSRWNSYTPTFYNQDNSTVVTPLSESFKFKKVGQSVFVQGYASFTSGDLNSNTYFSIPYQGFWPADSSSDARAMRGTAYTDANAFAKVTGVFSNTRLNINPTTGTTTEIGVNAVYEVDL